MKKNHNEKILKNERLVPYITGLVAIIVFVLSFQKMNMFALYFVLFVGSLFHRGTYNPPMSAGLYIWPISLVLGIILSLALSVGAAFLLTKLLLRKE